MELLDVVGLTLWWAEGTKVRPDKRWKDKFNYSVEITNTDSEIITTFLSYLRDRLGVQNEKIKIQLQIHQGDDRAELELFWSEITDVPISQFNKTIIRAVGYKVGKTKGTCKVRVHSKSLHIELINRLENLRGVVHRQNVRFGTGK